MANAALSAYWFTPDGQGAKKVIEKERKALLSSPLYAGQEGCFYFLTTSSMFPHISSVTLPVE